MSESAQDSSALSITVKANETAPQTYWGHYLKSKNCSLITYSETLPEPESGPLPSEEECEKLVRALRSSDEAKIYEHNSIKVFEFDPENAREYCQTLSKYGKSVLQGFLGDVIDQFENQMFYVLYKKQKHLEKLVGFFTKEKHSQEHLLDTIVVLRPFRRQGYGRFLLEIAHQMGIVQGVAAHPRVPHTSAFSFLYADFIYTKVVQFSSNNEDSRSTELPFFVKSFVEETAIHPLRIGEFFIANQWFSIGGGNGFVRVDGTFLSKARDAHNKNVNLIAFKRANFTWTPNGNFPDLHAIFEIYSPYSLVRMIAKNLPTERRTMEKCYPEEWTCWKTFLVQSIEREVPIGPIPNVANGDPPGNRDGDLIDIPNDPAPEDLAPNDHAVDDSAPEDSASEDQVPDDHDLDDSAPDDLAPNDRPLADPALDYPFDSFDQEDSEFDPKYSALCIHPTSSREDDTLCLCRFFQ